MIFLDEPTTGLDPISRREFWEILNEIGKERFIFLTTHYMEEAEELADQIGILDRGKLLRIGTMEQLRQSVDYNYSLQILSSPPPKIPFVRHGEIIQSKEGLRILTGEEEAFRIATELSKGGYRFAINPVSLDDIFFYLVNKDVAKENGDKTAGQQRRRTTLSKRQRSARGIGSTKSSLRFSSTRTTR